VLCTFSKEAEIFWVIPPVLWGVFAIVREAREILSFYSDFFFPGGSAKVQNKAWHMAPVNSASRSSA
jgi:hypothetical protein